MKMKSISQTSNSKNKIQIWINDLGSLHDIDRVTARSLSTGEGMNAVPGLFHALSKGDQDMRIPLRDRLPITGRFHKDGPNTGLFLQMTAEDVEAVALPGAPYTFGLFKRAQDLGDLEALRKQERRIGRIHPGLDIVGGLEILKEDLKSALQSEKVKP